MSSITFTNVTKRYGDGLRAVDALNLEIREGEFMVVVGPSGCGKTTALRMAAGLEEISDGELRIGDKIVNYLEPRERDIAMVFQNYALYPHMTVFENIAFPLENLGLDRAEIAKRVTGAAETLGLTEHLQRRPKSLSGGQRQRVAMGRAIVRKPKAFLMDEPLSNLDAKLRVQMRAEITRLQRELGVTTLYVTHDQVEAMTMGHRIAVMRRGVLQQVGTPLELYERPANIFVGSFVGSPAMNLVPARLGRADQGFELRIGSQSIVLTEDFVTRRGLGSHIDGRLFVGIRPEHIQPVEGDGAGLPRLELTLEASEIVPPEQMLQLVLEIAPIKGRSAIDMVREVDVDAIEALPRPGGDGNTMAIIARCSTVQPFIRGRGRWEISLEEAQFFDFETGATLGACLSGTTHDTRVSQKVVG